jgi:hypothetical protein
VAATTVGANSSMKVPTAIAISGHPHTDAESENAPCTAPKPTANCSTCQTTAAPRVHACPRMVPTTTAASQAVAIAASTARAMAVWTDSGRPMNSSTKSTIVRPAISASSTVSRANSSQKSLGRCGVLTDLSHS